MRYIFREMKKQSFKQAELYLNSFTNYEKRASLTLKSADYDRMKHLLEKSGDPQEKVRSVHVTGSKGKGTFCLFLESLLRREGIRVGTYLSPHLECVTERIRLDGEQLSGEKFARYLFQLNDKPLLLIEDSDDRAIVSKECGDCPRLI